MRGENIAGVEIQSQVYEAAARESKRNDESFSEEEACLEMNGNKHRETPFLVFLKEHVIEDFV